MPVTDHPLILIKYGGNAMKNEELSERVCANLCKLAESGYRIVLVHGGGPFIAETLATYGVASEFVAGHRKTTDEAMPLIEMVLKGRVNGMLVRKFNKRGLRAVGLSGKDGRMVIASRRYHIGMKEGKEVQIDIGWVGQIEHIDTSLIRILLENGFFPVITCIAADEEGNDYNINGDIMAGQLAGALQADHYIILTDVEGIMEDPNRPETVIRHTTISELKTKYAPFLKGGMLPKTESCELALNKGAKMAYILNGTDPQALPDLLLHDKACGTCIR